MVGKHFAVFTISILLTLGGSGCTKHNSTNPDTIRATWAATYRWSGDSYGTSVQQTMDGGFIVCGTVKSIDTQEKSVLLFKTNGNGDEIWHRVFGDSLNEIGKCVRQTTDGGYIILGYIYDIGGWIIKTDASGNVEWEQKHLAGSSDLHQTMDGGYVIAGSTYIVRLDNSGNLIWSHSIDNLGGDALSKVRQTTDGGFILLYEGYLEESLEQLIVLEKLDEEGNTAWIQNYHGAVSDNLGGSSVEQTKDGGFILACQNVVEGGIHDGMLLIKTNSDGNKTWEHTFGIDRGVQAVNAIQTSDGGYVILGNCNVFSDGDIWLIKTDTDGNQTWIQQITENVNLAHFVQQTSDDGYIIVGSTHPSESDQRYSLLLIKTEEDGVVGTL